MRYLREVKSIFFHGEEKDWKEGNTDDLSVTQASPTNIPQTAHKYGRNKGIRQQMQGMILNVIFVLCWVFSLKSFGWLKRGAWTPALMQRGSSCHSTDKNLHLFLSTSPSCQGKVSREMCCLWAGESLDSQHESGEDLHNIKRRQEGPRASVQRGKGQKAPLWEEGRSAALRDGEWDRSL